MTINQSVLLKSLKNNGVLADFEKDTKKINEKLASGANERELKPKRLNNNEDINVVNGMNLGVFVWLKCEQEGCEEKMYMRIWKKEDMKGCRCDKHK